MKSYLWTTTPLPGATTFALIQQAIVMFFCALILDGGGLAQVCLYALVAFWGGTGLLITRRGAALTRADIALIRWSYIPLCIVSGFLTYWIWSLRGY